MGRSDWTSWSTRRQPGKGTTVAPLALAPESWAPSKQGAAKQEGEEAECRAPGEWILALDSAQGSWQQLILPSDCSSKSSISSMMTRSALPSWSAL